MSRMKELSAEIQQMNEMIEMIGMEADVLNYKTTDTCDGCKQKAEGMMFHAKGATGRISPVLFLCHKCSNLHKKDIK